MFQYSYYVLYKNKESLNQICFRSVGSSNYFGQCVWLLGPSCSLSRHCLSTSRGDWETTPCIWITIAACIRGQVTPCFRRQCQVWEEATCFWRQHTITTLLWRLFQVTARFSEQWRRWVCNIILVSSKHHPSFVDLLFCSLCLCNPSHIPLVVQDELTVSRINSLKINTDWSREILPKIIWTNLATNTCHSI